MELIVSDSNHIQVVRQAVTELAGAFVFLDSVSESVFKLSQYTPAHAEQLEKWKTELIPAMRDSLVQNVKINNGFVKAVGKIANIAITLRQTAQLIQADRGSDVSVDLSSKNLRLVIDELTDTKNELDSLNMTILGTFERNAHFIVSLLGSEAAKGWVDNISQLRKEIQTLQNKIIVLENEKNQLLGEIHGMHNYRVSLQTFANKKDEAVQQMKSRMSSIESDIATNEKEMDSIPRTVTRTERTTHSGGWWLWRRNTTTTVERRVENTNRNSEIAFLKGIVQSKLDSASRIQDQKKREEEEQRIMAKELSNLDAQLMKKENDIKTMYTGNGVKANELKGYLEQIETLNQKISLIEKEAENAQNQYGLRGDVLINFLVETRNFLQKTQGEAKIIQPLVALLENVQAHFRLPLEYLEKANQLPSGDSEKTTRVFIAGKMMIKEIGLLDACASTLPTLRYTEQSARTEFVTRLGKSSVEGARHLLQISD